MKVSEFKQYLEENNLEFKVALKEKENGDDLTKQDIKFNPELFSETFISFFDEFLRLFKDYKFSDEDKEEIKEWRRIYFDFYEDLLEFQEIDTPSGKDFYSNEIKRIMQKNTEIVNKFFDLCWEVFDCEAD